MQRILMAQINPTVGAVATNKNKIIQIIQSQQENHDLIVFSELVLTGYPPEDLLFRDEFHQEVTLALKEIQEATKSCTVIVGHPAIENSRCYNCASVFYEGKQINQYRKQKLPNYEIFDEMRYFTPGNNHPCIIEINGMTWGVLICEDLWQSGPVEELIAHGVQGLICLNASPFDYTKYQRRVDLTRTFAQQGVFIIYVNQIGGQDDILFDGQSYMMDPTGTVLARAPAFKECLSSVILENGTIHGEMTPLLNKEALIYHALVCGTHDYVTKNRFPGVLLGLSGGIDSALTLAIAADALGAENVHALLMPSRYTADMSNEDALIQLKKMEISYSILSIEQTFSAMIETLAPEFVGQSPDITEENIQARLRGMLLMAMSNKTGKMVLATSNKSETAVGYATLYGDMCGGLSPLKDVLKTEVYAIAQFRNTISEIIPQRVFTRPPSAELRENQTDQDSLPDYPTLDAIITAYMVENLTPQEIIQKGFAKDTVFKIIQLIKRNEYKRRQSAPGIKISPIAYCKDWRYPLTNGF